MEDMLKYLAKTQRCLHPHCQSPITEVKADGDGDVLRLKAICGAGHESLFSYAFDAQQSKAVSKKASTILTKLSGVTFQNPDGVDRQSLLQYVKKGDELTVVPGEINGHSALMAKHALGVVGYIKKSSIAQLLTEGDASTLRARVTQITGGQAEKPTMGCNIEVWRENPEPKVYMDPDGRNIYHTDPHCSGLKDAAVVTKQYAEDFLHARACKRCCTGE